MPLTQGRILRSRSSQGRHKFCSRGDGGIVEVRHARDLHSLILTQVFAERE